MTSSSGADLIAARSSVPQFAAFKRSLSSAGEADPIEARLELRDELLRRLPKRRLLFSQILG